MSLLDFFRSRPLDMAEERKTSAGYALHMTGLPSAQWNSNRYQDYVREGFRSNVIAFRSVMTIATAVASIKWRVVKNGNPVDNHPVLKLLQNPNPMQSQTEFWRTKIAFLYLNGNSYDEKVAGAREIKELWTFRPDRFSIIPSGTGMPAGFEYRVGSRKVPYPADPNTGQSVIRHMRLFHPTDDWYGMSPFEAAAKAIDQHNEATNWLQRLLQNSARPSGAIIVPPNTALSDKQFATLKKSVEETYSGSDNAGRPMLLEGGMDWKAMGFSPLDMEILKLKDSAARDISLAFGVPPLLLNIPGDTTYANYKEARRGFYEDTIVPLCEYIADEYNAWLPEALKGGTLELDKDAIPALADRRTERWEMANTSDELTVDEARAIKGYPALPDAEKGGMLMSEMRATNRGHTETTSEKEPKDASKPLPANR
jgi:HK97 family phage portal protein